MYLHVHINYSDLGKFYVLCGYLTLTISTDSKYVGSDIPDPIVEERFAHKISLFISMSCQNFKSIQYSLYPYWECL